MRLPLALVVVGALGAPARAGGLALDLVSPRAVGRAGADVVGDDGAAAVVVNPAGLARRDARRAQLGLVVVDDGARYQASGSPRVDERGDSTLYPVIGAQAAVGPVVLGVALLDEAAFARRFAAPAAGQPADDVARLFPHRYAGLAASHRRRTLAVGASWRAREWLAIGASVGASRVSLDETRRVWAGFGGRDPIGDAARDVTVRTAGVDAFVPVGALGVLAAPTDVPVELAASVAWAGTAQLAGDVTATGATPGAPPTVRAVGATATAALAAPLVVRAGARWLSERWIAELDAEVWTYPRDPAIAWAIAGVTVIDDSGATAPLAQLASQVARRRHGAVRAAVDVEAVPGLVWLTAGWALASAATSTDTLSPAAGDLGGHTVALGAEVATDGFTITLGLARTFAPSVDVRYTRLGLDNPFDAGTAPTGLGQHAESRNTVALTFEAELP